MTELSRDEVLRIAKECLQGKQYEAVTYESGPYDIDCPTNDLVRFAAAMYAKGAADMKERAANVCDHYAENTRYDNYADLCSVDIRALPITTTNTKGEQDADV